MKVVLIAKGLAALAVVLVVVGMIEISSVASERRAARAARTSVFSDAVAPELPVGSEVATDESAATPSLTH